MLGLRSYFWKGGKQIIQMLEDGGKDQKSGNLGSQRVEGIGKAVVSLKLVVIR